MGLNVIMYSFRVTYKKFTEFVAYYSFIVSWGPINDEIIRNGFPFVIEESVKSFPIFSWIIPKTIKLSDIVFSLCYVQCKSEDTAIALVGALSLSGRFESDPSCTPPLTAPWDAHNHLNYWSTGVIPCQCGTGGARRSLFISAQCVNLILWCA